MKGKGRVAWRKGDEGTLRERPWGRERESEEGGGKVGMARREIGVLVSSLVMGGCRLEGSEEGKEGESDGVEETGLLGIVW